MTKDALLQILMKEMGPRLEQLGMKEKDLKPGLDLVNSGFVNSMEFVELIGSVERQTGIEIDYEKALDDTEFTTISGILKQFDTSGNG